MDSGCLSLVQYDISPSLFSPYSNGVECKRFRIMFAYEQILDELGGAWSDIMIRALIIPVYSTVARSIYGIQNTCIVEEVMEGQCNTAFRFF